MKKLIFCSICLIFSTTLFANDIATFHNLGFSEDSRYFLFAETGQNLEEGHVYVNGFLVDTMKNQFVKNGTRKNIYKSSINAGFSDGGAVLNLISEWNSFLNSYDINHLNTGRIVYSMEAGDEPKNSLSYRDFFTKKSYEIELNQIKSENPLQSAFFLSVKCTTAEGKVSSQIVGLPALKRKNVESYFIRQAVISPDDSALVFIIAKKMQINGEMAIRYMVETLPLR